MGRDFLMIFVFFLFKNVGTGFKDPGLLIAYPEPYFFGKM